MTSVVSPPLAYVGSVVPSEMVGTEPAVEISGNLFQHGLLAGLRDAGAQPFVVSFLPVARFPRDARLFIQGESRNYAEGGAARFIGFLNVPVLKQITQAAAIFRELAGWLRRHRGAAPVILLYNVFSPHALAVLAARACFGGRAVALVADLPFGLYDFRGAHGLLQRLDLWVQTTSLRWFDGLVPLTHLTAQDFAPRVPAMILEGAIDPATVPAQAPQDEPGKVVLFTGTLYPTNGIELLLAAFARIDDPEYRLWIYGRGSLEHAVRAAAATDSRITYFGYAPNATVRQRQREAAVLVNPRPSQQAITRYTFPSKLMEYMASGRPVVTTPLPSLPADYRDYLIVVERESPDGLAEAIRMAVESPASAARACAAQRFVLTRKTWTAQATRLWSFLQTIARTDGRPRGRGLVARP